jgi:hypothetical protein
MLTLAASAIESLQSARSSNGDAILTLTRFFRKILHRPRATRDIKRRGIIRELIETERNYVDGLQTCEDVYYKPLNASINSKTPLIDTISLTGVFGNLDEICALHHGVFEGFSAVLKAVGIPFPEHEVYLAILRPFLELTSRMSHLYSQYISVSGNYADVLKRLRKNKKFEAFLSECLFHPRAKCRELEDFLILPTQRIGSYRLMIERVINYFPPETFPAERAAAEKALLALGKVGDEMNAEKSPAAQDKLLSLAESLTRAPPFLVVLRPGRKWVHRAKVRSVDPATQKPMAKFFVSVTSDLLFVTQKIKGRLLGDRELFIAAIPIRRVHVGTCTIQKFRAVGFDLRGDMQTYHFVMKTTAETDLLLTKIRGIKSALKAKITRQTLAGTEYIQGVLSELAKQYTEPVTYPSKREALLSIA